nr:MAG TPA: hypothetical protein [Caudoviricetes sp.]
MLLFVIIKPYFLLFSALNFYLFIALKNAYKALKQAVYRHFYNNTYYRSELRQH